MAGRAFYVLSRKKKVLDTALVVLTDNSAGTADNTVAALADGTTYANDVAAIRNNFADLTAKVNELVARVNQSGL